VVFGDYDHHGWVDVFVANDSGPNFLFHHLGAAAEGGIRFEDMALLSGVALPLLLSWWRNHRIIEAHAWVDSPNSRTYFNLDRVLLYLAQADRLVLAREFYHPRLEDRVDRAHLQVEIPLRPDAGVTARCALERRAENVRDPENHPLINQELARRIGINPFAVAPMVARDELVGVIGVDRKFELGVIDDDELHVLIAFADQAAAALRSAGLQQAPLDPHLGPVGQSQ